MYMKERKREREREKKKKRERERGGGGGDSHRCVNVASLTNVARQETFCDCLRTRRTEPR